MECASLYIMLYMTDILELSQIHLQQVMTYYHWILHTLIPSLDDDRRYMRRVDTYWVNKDNKESYREPKMLKGYASLIKSF